jgi:hypothetical protein
MNYVVVAYRSHWYTLMLRLCMLIQCALIFFEPSMKRPPLMRPEYANFDETHNYLSLRQAACIELLCLCVFSFDLFMNALYIGAERFCKKKHHWALCAVMALLFGMSGCVLVWKRGVPHVRILRCLRPLIPCFKTKTIRTHIIIIIIMEITRFALLCLACLTHSLTSNQTNALYV